MRKGFKLYATIWGALYTVIIFSIVVATAMIGEPFTNLGAFWVGYAGILVAFLGQFICSCIAFRQDSLQNFLYNIPLIKISWSSMIFMFFVGFTVMLIPSLSNLIGALICVIVLAIDVCAVVKAKTAASIVSNIDDEIKTKTLFIKSLIIDADTLMANAKSEAIKAECKKVSEAIRYSDPMSNSALSSLECEITLKFAQLVEAVKTDEIENVASAAKDVLILIEERNKKCKLLK